jgi:hypothetical protein
MTKRIHPILWSLLLMLALASCSTTKTLKNAHFIDGMTETEYMEHVITNNGGWQALTAKVALSLDLEGKGATKVNGTLRIKKDEVIQLSIVPLLGIEVGRAEISPEGILVIDRMNKRYVKVSFSKVRELANADLDFHSLQALFLNELFLPGKDDLSARDASDFNVEAGAEGVVMDVKKTKRFAYRFLVQTSDALLKESTIALRNTPYSLRWEYDSFRPLEQKQFPTEMRVSFVGGKKPAKAAFGLSRLSTNSNWETHTEVSKRYEKVELEDILKLLIKK